MRATALACGVVGALACSEPAAPTDLARPIVFAQDAKNADGSTHTDLWSVQLDGTRLTNLTNTPDVYEFDPAVSPDGTRIVFASTEEPHGLWIMNADGAERRPLQSSAATHLAPAWSPDGARLAFKSLESAGGIWIMHSDGSNLRQVTSTGDYPTWSDDGSQLVYTEITCHQAVVTI